MMRIRTAGQRQRKQRELAWTTIEVGDATIQEDDRAVPLQEVRLDTWALCERPERALNPPPEQNPLQERPCEGSRDAHWPHLIVEPFPRLPVLRVARARSLGVFSNQS